MHSCLGLSDRKWAESWNYPRNAWRTVPSAAVRRLAEVQILPLHRVDSCATACRGLIVISTLDYLYHDKPLGCDLARQNVHDLLRGFGDSRYLKELES